MANKNNGQAKGAKGDKKAKKASVRRFAATPKIKGSKSARHCTPIAKKLRAEAAFQAAHKNDKWLNEQNRTASRSVEAKANTQPTFKFVKGEEKPIATSASFYAELAAAFKA